MDDLTDLQKKLLKGRTKTVKEQLEGKGISPKSGEDQYVDKTKEEPAKKKKAKDPEPAKGPEILKEKELTDADLKGLIRQALADNPPSRLQLNHLVFQIPPEQINIQHQLKNVSIGVFGLFFG